MPAALALTICVVFTAIALRVDGRRRPGVSVAVNLPLAWLLVRGSRPVGSWVYAFSGWAGPDLGGDLESIAEGSSHDRAFLATVMLLGLVVVLRRGGAFGTLLREHRWVFLLYAGCLVSLLWSDFPYIAFKRWYKGLGTLVMGAVVFTEVDPLEALKVVMKRAGYLLIPLSIVLIKYYREIGVLQDEFGVVIAGVATGKNPLGLLCCLCGLFFWWLLLTERSGGGYAGASGRLRLLVNGLLLVMVLWLFKMANSATAFGCFLIGGAIMHALELSSIRRHYRRIGRYLVLVAVIFFPLAWAGYDALLGVSLGVTGHEDTFWSRVRLWEVLVQEPVNPLLGVGYESFFLGERLEKLSALYWWFPTQAHNGYLQVYLELGILGLLLWSGALIGLYRSVLRHMERDYQFGKLQFALLGTFLVYNFTETSFTLRSLQWYVLLLTTMANQPTSAPSGRGTEVLT